MEPITVNTHINFKIYYQRCLLTMLQRPILLMLAGLFVFLNILTFWGNHFSWENEFYNAGFPILCYIMLMPVFLLLACKRNMKRAPLLSEATVYIIDPSTIAYKTESTAVQTNWKNIVKVTETDQYFFLYTNLKSFHFLAKDGFTGANDMDTFRDMVKANNVKAFLR